MDHPPTTLTNLILKFCSEINRLLGKYEGIMMPSPKPLLRRQNKIKTIQGSLEIEGNKLSVEQVTAILDGKKVLGPKKDILEVQNAIRAYDQIGEFDIFSLQSLLKSHKILMNELVENAGQWRKKSVGIVDKSKIVHLAPKADLVPKHMGNLFNFLKTEYKNNALLASCVFHYEFEFIHPFSDGNGRVGRLWQHAILLKYHPIFEYSPVESIIRDRQKEYYKALGTSDKSGESTPFIEFCLKAIHDSLKELLKNLKPEPHTPVSRLELARGQFNKEWFGRREYLQFFKTISTATASRDLLQGVKNKTLLVKGQKVLTKYKFNPES